MTKDYSEIVKKFKKGLISRREILKELSSTILSLPNYYGCFDKEAIAEFFAVIASKIEKIISRYKEFEEANFKTWFSVVLRNEFRTFIKKWTKMEFFETSEAYTLNTIYNNFKEDYLIEDDDLDKKKSIDYSFLSKNEKKILNFKFGINAEQVNLEHVKRAIKDKMDLRLKYEESINKKFVELVRIQQKINKETDRLKIEELKAKEKNIKKLKRKYEKRYNNINLNPSNKEVAQKLNYSQGTVSAYLCRIKNKFEKVGYENFIMQ